MTMKPPKPRDIWMMRLWMTGTVVGWTIILVGAGLLLSGCKGFQGIY